MRRIGRNWIPALLPALLVLACSGGESGRSRQQGPDSDSGSPPARTYRVRGVIRQLPRADQPGTQLLVHHEPISDFVGPTGELESMEAMTMAFPLASEMSLEGLAPGDKVVLTLEVDWSASTPARITTLEKMPPDTELEF